MHYDDDEWFDETLNPDDDDWCPLIPGVRRLTLQGNAPVRTINTGRRNRQVGGFWSHKMRAHIPHESENWELLGFKIQEVDTRVEKYYGQPEALEIRTDGETITEFGKTVLRYTLDTRIVIGGMSVRGEFKPREKLQPKAPLDQNDAKSIHDHKEARKLRRKLRIVQDAYRSIGELWILFTENELDAMGSPDTIDDIIANGGRDIDSDDLGRLCAALKCASGRRLTLGRCEELVRSSKFPRGAILARIPERILSINLFTPITSDTIVQLETPL